MSEINKVKRETFVWLSTHFGHKSKVVSVCFGHVTASRLLYLLIEQLDCHLPNFAFLASINHSIACNPGVSRHVIASSEAFFFEILATVPTHVNTWSNEQWFFDVFLSTIPDIKMVSVVFQYSMYNML